MKSKRKSLTGGKIPKRKRDKLKAQATYTPNWDIRDLADTQAREAAERKRQAAKNKKFNKNKWFFQKEREGASFGRYENGKHIKY